MSDPERKLTATDAKELLVRFLASVGFGGFNRGASPAPSTLLLEGELPKIEVPLGLGDIVLA